MRADLDSTFFRFSLDPSEVVAFLERDGATRARVAGPTPQQLDGVCDSRSGGHRQLAFCTGRSFAKAGALTESLILVNEIPDGAEMTTNQFVSVIDPKAAFIDVLRWLKAGIGLDPHFQGFSDAASISQDATIADSAIIEPGVHLEAGSVVCAGAVIKSGTRIGEGSIIKENAVVGTDGVTIYRAVDGRLLKFPHVGGVHIGSETEIGANSVVASGILVPTYIGDKVVIGNLCNIGHSASVGSGVWMSVGTLVGGHTAIHSSATVAMGVSIRDNIVIGESASLGMGSVVVKNVEAGQSMFGNPANRMPKLKTGPKR